MIKIRPDHFIWVNDSYQVHIWNPPERENPKGLLVSASKGNREAISVLLATTLRMMDGQTTIRQLIRKFAKQNDLTVQQSSMIVDAIVKQLAHENIIEIRKERFDVRLFPPPILNPYYLSILQVQLTNKCNLHCVHCYAKSTIDQNQVFPPEVFFRMIDEFAMMGGTKLFLTGGEPLLYPNLEDIIVHAKRRHLFIYLSTNGFAVTREKAERLVTLGIGAVNFSVDGSNADTHDMFRGKQGSFSRTLTAIDDFILHGIPCATQTTLHLGNLNQGAEIVNMLRTRGVRNCYFVRMMPVGRGKMNTNFIPTLEQYRISRLEEYKNRRLHYGENVHPKKANKGNKLVRCSAGISQLYIRADGACYPCPSLESTEFYLGKYPDQSLQEIWVNQQGPINDLRSFDVTSMDKCRVCEHQPVCKGGCAGNSLTVVGDWKAPDPHFCITMEIRKQVQSMTKEASIGESKHWETELA